eukprot:scaffold12404_cov132-Skeletonema_menzelii.AAC.7
MNTGLDCHAPPASTSTWVGWNNNYLWYCTKGDKGVDIEMVGFWMGASEWPTSSRPGPSLRLLIIVRTINIFSAHPAHNPALV